MTIIHARTALLPEGWARDVRVTLAQGRIAAVGVGVPQLAGAVVVDCLLPAMVNLHSHAFQRAMAGMTEARGAAPPQTRPTCLSRTSGSRMSDRVADFEMMYAPRHPWP